MDLNEPYQIKFPKAKLWIDQVPLFFHKDLKGSVNEVTYETKTLTEFDKGDSQTITLELDGFVMDELRDWLIEKYPNACSYFKSKKAKLVVYYGRTDWMGEDGEPQGLQVEDSGDMFLWWKVEDIGFFNGILINIKNFETVNLKIDLDVNDKHFDQESKDRDLNIPVAKLILTFN